MIKKKVSADSAKKRTIFKGEDSRKSARPGAPSKRRPERTGRSPRPNPIGIAGRPYAGETRKPYEEKSHDIVYGINPVLEVLRAGRGVEKIVLAEGRGGKEVSEIISLARGRNVKVSFAPRESLTGISRTEGHQGVVATLSSGRYSTLEEIMDKAMGSGEFPFILILDSIQDPQNLGAIIRSAVCAGVHGVVIPKDRAVGLTSVVEKTSAGALSYMAVARVTNIANTLEELKEAGLWITGTDGKAPKDMYSADFKRPLGLVIGSEGEGIRPLVAKKCDALISIPIRGRVSSLNASAAAAVVLYEVVRQRHK